MENPKTFGASMCSKLSTLMDEGTKYFHKSEENVSSFKKEDVHIKDTSEESEMFSNDISQQSEVFINDAINLKSIHSNDCIAISTSYQDEKPQEENIQSAEMELEEMENPEVHENDKLKSNLKNYRISKLLQAFVDSSTNLFAEINNQRSIPAENVSNSKNDDAIKQSEMLNEKYVKSTDLNSNGSGSISINQQDEKPPEENIPSDELKLQNQKKQAFENLHRKINAPDDSDSETDSSDSDTDSSDEDFFVKLRKSALPANGPIIKTTEEITVDDLLPVEDLHITEKADALEKIGKVFQIVNNRVVIASDLNSRPLDFDSVLFLSHKEPLGKIEEVFGTVIEPKYTVRFNKLDDIQSKGITIGQEVYYSPENEELTHYVLVDTLKGQKGSDASWEHDTERPEELLDYSDDEQERIAKHKRRAKNRKKEENYDDEVVEIMVPKETGKRHSYSRGASSMAANCFKPRRNHLQSFRPGSARAARSHLPIRSFVSTPPPSGDAAFGTLGIPNWGQSERHTPNSTTFDYLSSRPSSQIRQGSPFPQSSAPSPRPSSQIWEGSPFPQSSAPSPRPFESPPVYTTPSWSLGNSMQTDMSIREHFTTQVSAASAPSYVSASPQLNPAHYMGAPQQNPVPLMAAPQNNVPLQQQLLLQTQQSGTNFLSQPPPNYNPYQNSRTFGPQNPLQQSTETPTSRPTAPNAANQSFSNQNIFSTTNYHDTGLSNVNVSPFSNNSLNINRHQGQDFRMEQPRATNPLMFQQFPPISIQSNNIHHPIRPPVFGPNHSTFPSPCPSPQLVPCPSPQLVPCPSPQLVPSHTPPPFVPHSTPPLMPHPTPPFANQPGFTIFSPHPPVVPAASFQTPRSSIQPFPFNVSVAGNTMSGPQRYPYF